ncbi:hypothetical protein HDU97_007035 [Phlyctochytrium planicorne]|nr:hypothetical protein HDU97_007035 [Phlyctochytrium planicorne]
MSDLEEGRNLRTADDDAVSDLDEADMDVSASMNTSAAGPSSSSSASLLMRPKSSTSPSLSPEMSPRLKKPKKNPPKRANHNELERKRRLQQRDATLRLKDAIPSLQMDKPSTVLIVEKAKEYIETLRERIVFLEAELEKSYASRNLSYPPIPPGVQPPPFPNYPHPMHPPMYHQQAPYGGPGPRPGTVPPEGPFMSQQPQPFPPSSEPFNSSHLAPQQQFQQSPPQQTHTTPHPTNLQNPILPESTPSRFSMGNMNDPQIQNPQGVEQQQPGSQQMSMMIGNTSILPPQIITHHQLQLQPINSPETIHANIPTPALSSVDTNAPISVSQAPPQSIPTPTLSNLGSHSNVTSPLNVVVPGGVANSIRTPHATPMMIPMRRPAGHSFSSTTSSSNAASPTEPVDPNIKPNVPTWGLASMATSGSLGGMIGSAQQVGTNISRHSPPESGSGPGVVNPIVMSNVDMGMLQRGQTGAVSDMGRLSHPPHPHAYQIVPQPSMGPQQGLKGQGSAIQYVPAGQRPSVILPQNMQASHGAPHTPSTPTSSGLQSQAIMMENPSLNPSQMLAAVNAGNIALYPSLFQGHTQQSIPFMQGFPSSTPLTPRIEHRRNISSASAASASSVITPPEGPIPTPLDTPERGSNLYMSTEGSNTPSSENVDLRNKLTQIDGYFRKMNWESQMGGTMPPQSQPDHILSHLSFSDGAYVQQRQLEQQQHMQQQIRQMQQQQQQQQQEMMPEADTQVTLKRKRGRVKKEPKNE